MKRLKNYYLLFLVVLTGMLEAQAPRRFYTKFGGSGIDIGYSVVQTLDGQYIVTGSTSSFGQGNTDVYLVKIDSMGVILWQKTIGGFVNDIGRAIVQMPDSGFIIAGYSNSFGNGGYDAYTLRTDKNGNIVWQSSWGGNDWDFAYDLVKTMDGNIIICGSTQSMGSGKKDAFAVKYNATNGQIIWQKIIGGNEDDEFKGLSLDNTGQNVLVAGYTKSRGDVLGDMWAFRLATSNGDSLQRFMYGGNKVDFANDVVELTDNKVVLAGSSESYSYGKRDPFFAGFLPNGTFSWQYFYGTPSNDEEIFKIIRGNSQFSEMVHLGESYQISGYKQDIMTFPSNSYSFVATGYGGSFGFQEDELVYDMAPTKDKGFIQVGFTNSFNAVNSDVFLIKRDSVLNYGTSLVGVNENLKTETQFLLYPNPANEDITIQFSENISLPVKAELVGLDGKLLSVYNIYSPQEKLDLSKFENGMYLLKVYSKGFYKTIKLEKR